MSPHYLVKWRTCSSDLRYIFFQMFVAVKRAGCDGRQLEYHASNVSASVQSDHRMHGHTSSLFRQWPVASSIILCWNSVHVSTSLYRNWSLSWIGTRYALASCSRCSNLPDLDQNCWLATCQDWWTGMSDGAEARLCHERDVLLHCLAEIMQIIRSTY